MIHKLIQARRLIEAFLALMLGQRIAVHWEQRASMDNDGGVHLPMPQTGDAAEIALLTRLAVHEGGHFLETQPGFADRLTRQELGMFNALEDPRMESRQVQRYPGASLVLSRGLDEMLQNIDDRLEPCLAEAPERALQLDLLLRGFLSVAPHGPVARRAPGLMERLAPRLDETQRRAVDEAVGRLPQLRTSLETEDAARALVGRLRELELPPQGDCPSDSPADADNCGSEPSGPQEAPDAKGERPAAGALSGRADGPDTDALDDQVPENGEGASPSDPIGDPAEHGAEADLEDKAAHAADGNDGPRAGTDSDVEADAGREAPHDASAAGQGANCIPRDREGDAAQGDTDFLSPGRSSGDSEETDGPHAVDASDGASAQPVGSEGCGDNRTTAEPAAGRQSASGAGNASADGINAADNGRQPLDLGSLLRETLTARYGVAEDDLSLRESDPAAPPLSDEDLQQVEAMLAQSDPSVSLEQLLEASLVALAAGQGNGTEDGSRADGGGMFLASGATTPLNAIEMRLQGVESRLVTVLQRELQERRRRPTRAAYAGGRVMTPRYWRLAALGDTRVFVQKRNASGIDAAATVLLDSSYSMREQLRTAAEATMAFSLALQRLGVRTRVVRFPGVETVTETLQRFGESPRSCLQRCASLAASGGTPVGAATVAELPLLLAQRRLKNILTIVTDDDPGDGETLVRALECAEELDVLVVGVGIGCDVRHWIPNAVKVRDVNELPTALTALFRDRISARLAA